MPALRRLLARPHLAALICAAALLMKLAVPTGYMIASDHGQLAITLCPGMTPTERAPAMPMAHGDHAMPAGEHDHDAPDHGKSEQPCAFAGLAAAALDAVDPALLAVFVALILATGLVAIALPLPVAPAHLRPPLRGPPTYR